MTKTKLSPREAAVLDAVARCEAVAMHVLEGHLEQRIPRDELAVVVKSLEGKGLVLVAPAFRSDTVSITPAGQTAAIAARRSG